MRTGFITMMMKVAVLGDSENLLVGEEVIAIGNALGYGQSVTNGIVSAKDREIEMEGFDSKLIQTNAAINPGNSGGALLNSLGGGHWNQYSKSKRFCSGGNGICDPDF